MLLYIRGLFVASLLFCLSLSPAESADAPTSRQATGVKVGEVSSSSAIVWLRRTARTSRNTAGPIPKLERKVGTRLPEGVTVDTLHGACPGAAGRVRLRYSTNKDLKDARTTAWADVTARTDYSHSFSLTGLEPNTVYHYSAETTGPGGKPVDAPLRGQFRTAPRADARSNVTFTVVTGQAYKDLDHDDGFHIYPAMAKVQPHFIVPTGDTVYYDSDPPLANGVDLARYHWQRMYGLPRHIAFHLRVPGYWEKDDHDTMRDDCYPTMKPGFMQPLTFAEGLRLFREQVPMGEKTYRTYRWGKGLQVWMVEGRDFRSPNPMPDGPKKTIWGDEQKRWLFKTIQESDADWKVIISPTPIVGPDRSKKADNHANKAFQTEGDEVRNWVAKNGQGRLFLACGDRHWQYHSVHPGTKVEEFSCGPASDKHAGGSPGLDKDYHRFHRVKGGFLSVSVTWKDRASQIAFRLHDVHGKVMYEDVRTGNK